MPITGFSIGVMLLTKLASSTEDVTESSPAKFVRLTAGMETRVLERSSTSGTITTV